MSSLVSYSSSSRSRGRSPVLILSIFTFLLLQTIITLSSSSGASTGLAQAIPITRIKASKANNAPRNPFLMQNFELSGHDSNHHDLARALGVNVKTVKKHRRNEKRNLNKHNHGGSSTRSSFKSKRQQNQQSIS